MNKKLFCLYSILCIGFFLGAWASKTYLASDQYRALRMANLFERMCLQEFDWQAEKQRPPFFSLQSLKSNNDIFLDGSEEWTDKRSKTLIHRSLTGRCSVSVTEPFEANSTQVSMLMEHLETVKDRFYPNLVRDPGMDGTAPYAIGWFNGARNTSQRWGIFLFGASVGDDKFAVVLGYRAPPEKRN